MNSTHPDHLLVKYSYKGVEIVFGENPPLEPADLNGVGHLIDQNKLD